MHADKICVLHKGVLIEEGNHFDLMQEQSHYYKLWKQQIPVLEEQLKTPN